MILRATVPGKLLRPNHVRYIPRPTGCVLITQEILDPSVHYPVLDHHLDWDLAQRKVWYAMNDSRATVPGKWLRPNHGRYIQRPPGCVLIAQGIMDPSVYYPVQDHHLELRPCPTERLICHEWFKELLYQENGCDPITCGTSQDP